MGRNKLIMVCIPALLLSAALLLAAGCKDEKKSYTCDEAIDIMYDEDCELWCQNDGESTVYMDECAWYDEDDGDNFPKSLAEDICDEMDDLADDEDCEDEFEELKRCLADEADDDCAEDCEDPYDDFWDCAL